VGRNCHEFYRRVAENSIRIRFHLGNRGPTDQGGSIYTCQDHLVWATTSRAVYVEDSLSAWTTKEDCVYQRDTVYFEILEKAA
jgi:hypothetical protein